MPKRPPSCCTFIGLASYFLVPITRARAQSDETARLGFRLLEAVQKPLSRLRAVAARSDGGRMAVLSKVGIFDRNSPRWRVGGRAENLTARSKSQLEGAARAAQTV